MIFKKIKYLILAFTIGLLGLNFSYAQTSSSKEAYLKALNSLKTAQESYKAALVEYLSSTHIAEFQNTFIEKTTDFLKQANSTLSLNIGALSENIKNETYLPQNFKDQFNDTIGKYQTSLAIQKEGIEAINNLFDLKYYLIEMQNFKIQLLIDSRTISARILIERSKAGKQKTEDLFTKIKQAKPTLTEKQSSDIEKLEQAISQKMNLAQQNIDASEIVIEQIQSWETADSLHNEIVHLTNEANRNIIETTSDLKNILKIIKQ